MALQVMTKAQAIASLAAFVVASVVTGCSGNATGADDGAVCSAYQAGRSHVEVVADGTVTRLLGTHAGVESPHEGFLFHLASGCSLIVRVESNVDFTGAIPLDRGEHVVVKGEYEYYPRGGVIHWTHRDPRGRHEGGYVQVDGKIYD
jgi:hypothetical protein